MAKKFSCSVSIASLTIRTTTMTPSGNDQMFHLDPLTMGCPMEFSLTQIANRARAMIDKAGFPQAATAVNEQEIIDRIDEIRKAIQAEQSVVENS